MAVWLARSRIIFHRLSKQMGVLGVVHNNNSWKTSVHSSGSSAMSHGDKYGRPHAFMGNSASRFHLHVSNPLKLRANWIRSTSTRLMMMR
ncbi:hypothetical protein CJ030_MR3G022606 [Morella rubra]|uniref:Uncharacterized protein n=1 Tax=Morella rubra TaxID=262757 RepID=A0A6A1W6J7_9ROSI|nr:hypothetical protein CJ030_MR3G022606 [Morella rubra]